MATKLFANANRPIAKPLLGPVSVNSPRPRTFLDSLLFPNMKKEQLAETYKHTTIIIPARLEPEIVSSASGTSSRREEANSEDELEFEDIVESAAAARAKEEPGLARRVYSTVSSFLYTSGEPAGPAPKVQLEKPRQRHRGDTFEERDSGSSDSFSGSAPRAGMGAKTKGKPGQSGFVPPPIATTANALAAASKIDRLVREFPEAFGATPKDPYAPSDVILRDSGAPDPTPKPQKQTAPIPEGKLRGFLIRESQNDRPDANLNPVMSRTPVGSRKFLNNNVSQAVAGSKSASARAKVGQRVRVRHALEDAQRYKQPTEQLWSDYFSIGVKGVTGWQALVEERIEQARREGQFENLQGSGERLHYIDNDPSARNPFLDNVEYHLNKSIMAQGLRPAFIEQSLEIEAEVSSLRRELKALHRKSITTPSLPGVGGNRDSYYAHAKAHAEQRVPLINERIRGWNLTIPKGIGRKFPLNLETEIKRGRENKEESTRRKGIEDMKVDEMMKIFFERWVCKRVYIEESKTV